MNRILNLNFIFFLLLFIPGINVIAQNIEDIRISGTYKNKTVISFLNDIESKYNISFYYNPDWFQNDTINFFFNETPLRDALQRTIKGKTAVKVQNASYVFIPDEDLATFFSKDFNIKDDYSTKIIGDPKETGKYGKVAVKGSINDGQTGEPLIGATMQIENTNVACVTNLNGQYVLNTTPGVYNLIISCVGYEKTSQKVRVISNGNLNIELFEKAFKINEIIILAQKADRNVRSSQMSVLELDSKAIKQLPSIIGEKDIIKSLTMMPGVKSAGEFGAGINIRGGSTDQNLFLLEGAPLFNTSHVFGLISVINPDAVNAVTLYKGHIPSNFGERVSSVMDIQLKDNNPQRTNGIGGIGLFNSRLMLDVPIYKEKISLKIGGRTSYSNWMLQQLKDYNLRTSKIGFYDLNCILTSNFDKNRIVLFAYNSNDNFGYAKEMKYAYKNILGSFNWNHYFSRDASSSLVYSFSRYEMSKDDVAAIKEEQTNFFSQVNYHTLKFNYQTRMKNAHTVDAGINSMYYKFLPGERTPLYNGGILPVLIIQKENGLENTLYVNDKWDINDRFSVNAGIRYSTFMQLGPGTVYNYIPGRTKLPDTRTDSTFYGSGKIMNFYNALEPRIALKVQIDNTSSVKLSFNRNMQYISMVSSTTVPSPSDVWKIADKYIKPVDCMHYVLGYYKNLNQNKIESSVEIYYKNLYNLLEYKNGARLELNKNIETDLINAKGKNYGIEFFLKKNTGEVDGWISYTYSRSLKRTQSKYADEIINNNKYYPSSFDKPHDVTVTATWHVNRRLRVSGNFNYSTGRSVTLPELKYKIMGQQVIQYSDRNKYRLPDYHRLDLSVSVDESLRIKKKWKGSWTFSILNVYGRKNAYSVYYMKETPSVENNYKKFSLYNLYIIGIPFPTFTYNFIF